tara:strand:+ start:238 stop:1347 length:1110 start_codon:yes stop_codon:yes gene_type:complete
MRYKWFEIISPEKVISPSLLVFPSRVEENIKTMIKISGDVKKLRPHIKTYKIKEIIQLQIDHGINKFKCATIAEAELLAMSKVKDILLAIQPVGTNIDRFFNLIKKYPESKFSTIVDSEDIIDQIDRKASRNKVITPLFLDINNGMNRTGVLPDEKAIDLYVKISESKNLIANGLHVYDGHIRESNFNLRKRECDKDFKKVEKLIKNLKNLNLDIKTVIAGGTPTFPIHSKRKNIEVSPGTSLLWDERYGSMFKDLKFLPAAVLFGRLISKPKNNLICFNLGHKSVAAEMNFPRLKFLNYSDTNQIGQSEEHLVVECLDSSKYNIGDICYAIPQHVCPTVPKYNDVITVENNKVMGNWKVIARDYKINI